MKKTKEVKDVLLKLGLEKELERISKKTARSGKGRIRNRKYRIKKGPLFVVSKLCSLEKEKLFTNSPVYTEKEKQDESV